VRQRSSRDDRGQIGVIGVAISLGVVAILTAIIIGISFGSGNGGTDTSGDDGVGQASDIQAQQDLSQAVTAVRAVGSQGAAALQEAEPSLSFVNGPTSEPNVISVASVPGAASPGAASSGATIPGVPGVTVPGSAGSAPATSGGSTTIASYAPTTRNCWFIYSDGGALFYGLQTDQASCTAPALATAPAAGAASASAIGWQANQFPAT